MEMPPPGWYEDPSGPGDLLRWWDGSQWTARTAAAYGGLPDAAAYGEFPGEAVRGDSAAEAAHGQSLDKWAPSAQPNGGPLDAPALPSPAPALPGPAQADPGPALDQSRLALEQPRPARGQGDPTQVLPSPARDDSPSPLDPVDPVDPAGDNATRALVLQGVPWDEGSGGGALARPTGPPWQRDSAAGTASTVGTAGVTGLPIWDPEDGTTAPRRNHTRLMWALAFGTAVAVLMIGGLVGVFGSMNAAHTVPAAAVQHPSAVSHLSPSPAVSPSATASPAATTGTPVSDAASGLSYAMLGTPWQPGCPTTRNNSAFTWTAGESAVAGTVGSGTGNAWYGSTCSGLLGQQYGYTGVAGLEQTATNLVNTFDPAYYNGLAHVRTAQGNDPLQVSGHPAWIVKFLMTYPNAASQGIAWQAEAGAVVVVDRGTGQAPAVLYLTVPDNLGIANVDVILQSLQLAAPPAAPTPPASTAPGDHQGGDHHPGKGN